MAVSAKEQRGIDLLEEKIKELFLNVRQTSGQVVHRFKLWITCFCIFNDPKYFRDKVDSEGECSIYSYEQICKIKK